MGSFVFPVYKERFICLSVCSLAISSLIIVYETLNVREMPWFLYNGNIIVCVKSDPDPDPDRTCIVAMLID